MLVSYVITLIRSFHRWIFTLGIDKCWQVPQYWNGQIWAQVEVRVQGPELRKAGKGVFIAGEPRQ